MIRLFKALSLGIIILFGVLLLTNLDKGVVQHATDRLFVQERAHASLEQILTRYPEAQLANPEQHLVTVPEGTAEDYRSRFQKDHDVEMAALIPVPEHFSFKKYIGEFKKQLNRYANGDLGGLTYQSRPDREYPIASQLSLLMKRSLTYLIPGLVLSLFFGYALAVFAAWQPRGGRLLDRVHSLLLGVPDFFLIVLLQLAAILVAKAAGRKVFTVMQYGTDTPVLIPLLAVTLLPAIILYGAMRIAIEREWDATYIKTAYAKGLTGTMVLFKHILRNTTADLLAILPRVVSVAITTLVVAEVLSGIFGLGGYAIHSRVVRVTSLTTTCMILACVALVTHFIVEWVRGKFLLRHESVSVGGGRTLYTKGDVWRFRIASALFGGVVFIAVFGSYLMPHSITPEHQLHIVQETVDGVTEYLTPPLAPSSTFWFGTDHRGYDLLSLYLNGAKYTLGLALAVTAVRFLIALPLGMLVGLTGKGRFVVSALQLVTSAVPVLLFLFPILYGLAATLGLGEVDDPQDPRILLFAKVMFGLLVLFGTFQLAQQFSERAHHYSGSLYITAARTMGASTGRIMFKHLLPQLRTEVVFTFLVEFAQVMFLIGQLAVLGYFFSGGEVVELGPLDEVIVPLIGEWGGMIAYGTKTLRYYPWIMLSIGTVFTLTIVTTLFFAKELQKRIAQPRVQQVPLYRNRPVLTTLGTVVVAGVLLVMFVPSKAPTLEQQAEPAIAQPASPQAGKDTKAVDARIKQGIADSTRDAQRFMEYISQGKWDYAETLIWREHKPGENYMATKAPTKPFDRWLEAFTKLGYKYVGVGEGRLVEDQERGWAGFDMEIKVTDSQGNPQTWHLKVNGMVFGGEGEPTP